MDKFNLKTDVDIFLGYSNSSKTYIVFNKRTLLLKSGLASSINILGIQDSCGDIRNIRIVEIVVEVTQNRHFVGLRNGKDVCHHRPSCL